MDEYHSFLPFQFGFDGIVKLILNFATIKIYCIVFFHY